MARLPNLNILTLPGVKSHCSKSCDTSATNNLCPVALALQTLNSRSGLQICLHAENNMQKITAVQRPVLVVSVQIVLDVSAPVI